MMKTTCKILAILLFNTSCFYNDSIPPDQNVWPVANPGDLNMNTEVLMAMDSAVNIHPNEGITSIVVVKEGSLVFENYYFGNDRSTLFDLSGVSSSLSNLALGRAIDMGLITSVDDSLYKYLPAFAQEFEDFPLKKNITFEHLMTMKSGLSWNEFSTAFDGQENDIDRIIQSDDWVEYLITKPIDVLPGRRFSHNSAVPVLIAAAIENQYNDGYQSFLMKEVFGTLEVNNFDIANFRGNINSAWGISMSTLDLAKVGYLYLKRGDWFGRQVINENYMTSSVDVQANIDYYNSFGWMWWRYSDNSNFLSLSENDVFFAAGIGNQRLYVVPHLELVVAITGENEQFDFTLTAPFVLKDYILESIQ
ncbi:MAG: serine hydrolase [Reichenbachiella sp.]|uniref:serine hydrolase domain-containing protein n=1 Tax=Reichenbachiella sp. TaxID=2184521 RepID=UPI00326756DE